jgi:hypothetical protein
MRIPQFDCSSDVLANRAGRWLALSAGEKRLVGKRESGTLSCKQSGGEREDANRYR